MGRPARLLVLALPLPLAVGCIPMRKTYVLRPDGIVRVVDGKGAPIAGARVSLIRHRHPHGRNDAEWRTTADARGEVAFTREERTQTVFPLMMHGVPAYSFVACAEAPGYAGTTAQWSAPAGGGQFGTLAIELPEGERPCDAPIDLAPPPAGEARLLARVRKGADEWTLDLTLARAEPIAVGARLGGLVVTKVAWQSEPPSEVRRATVEVRGDAAGLRVGQSIVRGAVAQ